MTASTAGSRSGRSASRGTRYGMPASRIFAFARTSRCAMVGSGTRKARAISGVLSPPSSRRVSATRAAGASAGWQQVKIRRSRSSDTGPSSAGSGACTRAASACRSARMASRRNRSTARLRAVVMIQPAGLAGSPAAGQRCTAAVNASWTASSASPMSPSRRTRTDTARPYSARKICSISASDGALIGRAAPRSAAGPRRRPCGSTPARRPDPRPGSPPRRRRAPCPPGTGRR